MDNKRLVLLLVCLSAVVISARRIGIPIPSWINGKPDASCWRGKPCPKGWFCYKTPTAAFGYCVKGRVYCLHCCGPPPCCNFCNGQILKAE